MKCGAADRRLRCAVHAEVYRNKKQYPSAKEHAHVCIVRYVTAFFGFLHTFVLRVNPWLFASVHSPACALCMGAACQQG